MKKTNATRMAVWSALCIALWTNGCAEECADGMCGSLVGETGTTKAPLTAYCQIAVSGYGTVNIESDYVPNVTWCENGNAPDQALRAQAVAARGFAYYKLNHNMGTSSNPVQNSQGDQVYKCESRSPSDAQLQRCIDATNDTSGTVLMYGSTVICTFYVSGTKGDCLDSTCRDNGTCSLSVQKNVTYNEGKSGSNITQTSLGWVSPSNKENRGCMSQNGSSCLANLGWGWERIVKFFYGEDAIPVKATGSCVAEAPKCETKLDRSGAVIDDMDPCFSRNSSTSWWEGNAGYNSHYYYTYVWDKAAESVGTWTINVTRPGTYEIFANIPANVGALSEKAPYTVRAGGSEYKKAVNLSGKSGWVSIGKYSFTEGGDQWVKLDDASGEAYTDKNGKRVVFDALKFEDAVICTDQCSAKGSQECVSNGWRKCADSNGDGCLEWSGVTECGAGTTCQGGACVAQEETCEDECAAPGVRECVGESVSWRECGQFDDDSCLDWSASTACGPAEKCEEGACVPVEEEVLECSHDCIDGERICDADGVKTCGQFDEDECRDWSEVEPCQEGYSCRNGVCRADEPVVEPSRCVLKIDGRKSTIIDETDPCFSKTGNNWSELLDYGYNAHIYYTPVNMSGSAKSTGTWTLNVTKSGLYSIYAYIEYGIGNVVDRALYTIKAGSDDKALYAVPLVDRSGWVKIGDVELVAGENQYVQLSDTSIDPDEANAGRRLVFDAIKVMPYEEAQDEETGDGSTESGVRYVEDSNCSYHRRRTENGCSISYIGILLAIGSGIILYRRRREDGADEKNKNS